MSATPPPAPPALGDEDYFSGLRVSLIAHAGIVLFIILKAVVFPSKATLYVPTLRVDIVGLPDILKKDLTKVPRTPSLDEIAQALKKVDEEYRKKPPAPVVKAKAPEAPPKTDEMVLKPKRAVEHEEHAREKKIHNALARVNALNKILEKQRASAVIRGNQVSKGTSLSGDAKESAQASYYDALRDKLQENWALPVWLARQQLSAQVRLFITSKGQLKAFIFTKPSGNPQFDDAVKRSIAQSQPFPAPPAELGQVTVLDGVLVGFPL